MGPAFTANESNLNNGFELLPDEDTIHIHNPRVKIKRNFKRILRARLSTLSKGTLKELSNVYLAGKTGKRAIVNGLVNYTYNFAKQKGGNWIIAGREGFSSKDRGAGFLITRKGQILYRKNKNSKTTVYTNY